MSEDKAVQGKALESLAVESIMKSKDNRAYLYSMLVGSGVFTDGFDPDPYKHARNAGRRLHGLMFQADMQTHAPELYLMMLKENSDE